MHQPMKVELPTKVLQPVKVELPVDSQGELGLHAEPGLPAKLGLPAMLGAPASPLKPPAKPLSLPAKSLAQPTKSLELPAKSLGLPAKSPKSLRWGPGPADGSELAGEEAEAELEADDSEPMVGRSRSLRVPPGLDPPVGTPSHGSVLHEMGGCRPCAWYWKPGSCQNGKNCLHCHSCPEGELKARKKAKQTMMRLGLATPKFKFEPPKDREAGAALSFFPEPELKPAHAAEPESTTCSGSELESVAGSGSDLEAKASSKGGPGRGAGTPKRGAGTPKRSAARQ